MIRNFSAIMFLPYCRFCRGAAYLATLGSMDKRRDIPRHTVTFGVTIAGRGEKSEPPRDGTIRVWTIRAEVSRPDSRGQVAAERWDDLRDSVDSLFDPLGDGCKRPFGFGRRAPVPAAKSDGSGELLGYGVYLAASSGSTVGIVKPLGLLKVVSQLVNPALVFCFGL